MTAFERKQKEDIQTYLDGLNIGDLVRIHNAYCEKNICPDDEIYFMDDLEDHLRDLDPLRIVCLVTFGSINPHDKYFWYNGDGNLESSDFPYSEIFTSDIANTCVINDEDFDDDEIREILDREEEGEEE